MPDKEYTSQQRYKINKKAVIEYYEHLKEIDLYSPEEICKSKENVRLLMATLDLISTIAYDYDGCNTVDSLKELVDCLKDFADAAISIVLNKTEADNVKQRDRSG